MLLFSDSRLEHCWLFCVRHCIISVIIISRFCVLWHWHCWQTWVLFFDIVHCWQTLVSFCDTDTVDRLECCFVTLTLLTDLSVVLWHWHCWQTWVLFCDIDTVDRLECEKLWWCCCVFLFLVFVSVAVLLSLRHYHGLCTVWQTAGLQNLYP